VFSRLGVLFSFIKGKPSEFIPKLIKAVAEGKFGEPAKKIYWQVAGYKTWITAIVATVGFALQQFEQAGLCPDCAGWSVILYQVALGLLAVGLFDGAVRLDPPKDPNGK
jgi:hypothetical protein